MPATQEDGGETSPTLPLPAFRRHLLQVAAPAGPAALGGASPLGRATRRLMVTPWFAVATGFVVAAGLWIYSPHAELKFPNAIVGRVPCQSQDCGIAGSTNRGLPATAGLLPPGTPAVKSAGKLPTVRVARGLKFGYRVLWQSQGKFGMLITVSGRRIPHTWRMTFAMPGDQIIAVEGAAWHPSGSSGGTVSWPAPNATWQSSGGSSDQGGSFLVFAAGPLAAPTTCSFNGASCRFS